ncbi:PREDICTED: uncharacterized protein LOC105312089 [Amphimedon queenslandica]|uniref:Lysine-specific metallo-endopeptidase domain-containing protein n=1 Tax=Amphimedon queenslandica TaxID=400682 RepID=A0A1X7V9S4_AMPQE|nr:PREDICTED: uncharacterized protein LOC105312089 [Amphimedon queenslandica]|eukprot:XP_011402759.1 PREDICTED: uncharacterized protein LOC105312089 [Amphimedon queenslandica]
MKKLAALVYLGVYLICVSGTSNSWPISLSMSCYEVQPKVACSFDFTNNANQDYYLLKRNTPLEGMFSPFVAISYNGAPLNYEGIVAYRFPPVQNEFVLIKPGESVSAIAYISDAFNLRSDGLYSISYVSPLEFLSKEQMEMTAFDAKIRYANHLEVSESVQISLKNTHMLLRPSFIDTHSQDADRQIVTIKGCDSASFIGGNQTQRDDVLAAHIKLCAQFGSARKIVQNDAFYKTWFGEYTAERSNKVKLVLQQCEDGITQDTVTYDMNGLYCFIPFSYAYYVRGEKAKVHLCALFHDVKSVTCREDGDASKEQILAHEWTHCYGGTEDYMTYGEEDNKAMAMNDPDKAVNHADSYAYYYCLAYWQ